MSVLSLNAETSLYGCQKMRSSHGMEKSNDLVGRPKVYSDLAIETALSLHLIFKLPLRQIEGLPTPLEVGQHGLKCNLASNLNEVSVRAITFH